MDRDRWEERWQRRAERRPRFRLYRNRPGGGNYLLGIFLIGFGVFYLLSNLGIIGDVTFRDLWPVILIVVGVSSMARCRSGRVPIMGILLTGFGAILLLRNFGVIDRDVWRYVWPAMLIVAGVGLLLRRSDWHGRLGGASTSSADTLDEFALFGGVERNVTSQEFAGGSVFASFGGVQLDLRQAATKLDEVIIDARAVFGGIEIRVPDTWSVTVRGSGIFGGYEDETTAKPVADGKRPHLVVTGEAIFGGVSVKN